jgi:hypothetical protein
MAADTPDVVLDLVAPGEDGGAAPHPTTAKP